MAGQKEKGQKQAMIKLYNVNIDFLSAHDTFLSFLFIILVSGGIICSVVDVLQQA
jgi:hypothetical protein